ncbi:nucleoside deaminase [Synoicihabitans lomoniglobus]|uniref:tRNA-specific adenosine deaminase n=1 Tax=Synoicihabitans lomoniglobus TaxID=2909285 RepID=A0AAE9ZSL4_9BACT|nr:nucleoside deaminase [Opitutaceae bacterium LMO-M01]WED63496.1 nucleoside deaminase [Opitutaceae bacterium LMO-M01]
MSVPPEKPFPCPFEKRFPSQLVRDDTFFMSLAFNQAIDAWRCDEVPIGCVIEREGEVIAFAHNTVEHGEDPTAHAEMLAITQAAAAIGNWRLENCTLYVTKEPCPMCSGATLMSRLKRVVYAVPDPKMGCLGGATNLSELPRVNHRCEITAGGVLEDECRELIRAYFKLKRAAPGASSEENGSGD